MVLQMHRITNQMKSSTMVVTGTAAFRSGGRSFPRALGTSALTHAPLVDVAVAQPTPPRPPWRDEITVLSKKIVQERFEADLESRALQEHCLQHVRENGETKHAALLQLTPPLLELGTWLSFRPDTGAEQCGLCFDAMSACSSQDTGEHCISKFRSQWQHRHVGIPRAAKVKVKGRQESKCFQTGVCHCRRSCRGMRAAALWQKAQVVLKQYFAEKPVGEALLDADICLLWLPDVSCERENHAQVLAKTVRCTSVPCHYLRPWRPTLLELAPATEECKTILLELSEQLLRKSLPETYKDTFVNFRVNLLDRGPAFFTVLEFFKTLDSSLSWRVALMQLSQSRRPFVNSDGLVRASLISAECLRFWSGAEDPGEDVQHLVTGEDDESLLEGGEGEQRPEEEEEQQEDDDEEAEEDEGIIDDIDMFFFDEDTVTEAPKEQEQDQCKADSSSSSSNSSSSSSSDEAKAEKPPKKARNDTNVTARTTRDRGNYEEFGSHHMVKRFKDGTLIGYQMTCKRHLLCSREMAFTVGGDEDMTRRLLKTWVLLGEGIPSKELHMNGQWKKELLEAKKEGRVLTEAELDNLVTLVGKKQAFEAPFKTVPSVTSRPLTLQAVLGMKASDVPEELHAAMSKAALEGRIPITTYAQRERNRQTTNTDYHVPEQLLGALRYGYVSPNLAAPTGMVWRCYAGTWRLGLQGG
eukprot:2236395-Amphidinium_carterae.1